MKGQDGTMKHWFRRGSAVALVGAALALAQVAPHEDSKLPNGKSQRDEILKAEHHANVKDATELVDLAQQLQQEVEKNDRFVLSISAMKKTDEIEKLAKKIRARMRRY
jgi:hypothetical protein